MNYNLKLAVRNLFRQRIGSIINIVGFTLSLTVCLLIALYVQYEFAFEKHNKNANHIYRLLVGETKYVPHPIMFFKPIRENVPELQNATLVFKRSSQFFNVNNEKKVLKNVVYTNNKFLSFFNIKMLKGASDNLLDVPNAALLSKSEAKKLFPDGKAIGKIIKCENRYDMVVKGVFEDVPITANYRPNLILNYEAIKTLDEYQYTSNGYSSSAFYFMLPGKPNFETIKSKIIEQGKISYNDDNFDAKYHFQPLSDIHLYSADTSWDAIKRSDINMLRTFIIIAFLVLVIAVFNFINLSLSLSAKRNFNTGIQKVFGANRYSIIKYFFTETSLIISICIVGALLLTYVLIPYFNQIMEMQLTFSIVNPILWLTILGVALLNIILPTVVQVRNKMRLNPVMVMKSRGKIGGQTTKSGYSAVTQSLTVVQIAITIVLISGVLTMNQQFDLLLNKKLGFDKSNLITVVNPFAEGTVERHSLFKNELDKLPCVKSVTATFNSPGNALNNGDWLLKMGKDSSDFYVKRSPVDADYFKTMQTQFILGKPFASDSNKIVINETCWRELGIENPIGITVERKFGKGRQYEICGVIEDIQNQSLKDKNDAAVYYLNDFLFTFIVRLAQGDMQQNLATVETAWNKIESNYPFQYSFVDEDLQANYKKDIRLSKLLNMVSVLAIVLSMLGLFALSLQIIERRTKEIGIRKINGATITEILTMLNTNFIKWVVIAFAIATPIAYYAMNFWLENFAYKTTLSWWIFALAGISAAAIALLTVSWQSWRAASRNPVEALRYE